MKEDIEIIKKELSKAIKNQLPAINKRNEKLTSSNLPYCPLKEFYCSFMTEEKPTLLNIAYMEIGTVIHSVFQHYIPQGFEKIDIMGSWEKCADPQCPHTIIMNKDGCEACGEPRKYNELYMKNDIMKSRTDSIYVIRGTKRAYIIDYKTCNTRTGWLLNNNSRKFELPNEYLLQLDSYAVMFGPLIEEAGYRLHGSILVYIERDNPGKIYPILVHEYNKKKIKKTRKLLRKMSSGYDYISSIGDEKKSMDHALEAVKYKICKTEEDYYKIMHKRYDICPLKDVCFGKRLHEKLEELF